MIINKFLFGKHLEEGEKILYVIHRHWIAVFKPSLEIAFFGFILPWSLYFIGFNTSLFFWIALIWSILAYIQFMRILVNWYCNSWLITDMNVITIEWSGIFNNVSARIGYEDIEGASYEIKGFWPTVLRYGDMTLRVMSGSHFNLKNVDKPKKAELALARFQDKYLNDRNMQDTTSLKTLLSDLVSHQIRSTK